jgi:hypothetical protein
MLRVLSVAYTKEPSGRRVRPRHVIKSGKVGAELVRSIIVLTIKEHARIL